MRIHTSENEEYTVRDETITVFFASILAYILAEYEKLPDHLKLLAMALTRGILLMSEVKESDPEKKKLFRPEKRGDPNLHLIRLLVDRLAAVMPGVEIEVVADEQRTISAVYLKNSDTSGRSIPHDGGFGQREDDGCETLRPASRQAVPNT
jgi:hypothetical protein